MEGERRRAVIRTYCDAVVVIVLGAEISTRNLVRLELIIDEYGGSPRSKAEGFESRLHIRLASRADHKFCVALKVKHIPFGDGLDSSACPAGCSVVLEAIVSWNWIMVRDQ